MLFRTQRYLFVAAFISYIASAPVSGPVSGLYGLAENGSLIRSIDGGANWTILGSPLPYDQAQQLSCIDSSHSTFYMIYNDILHICYTRNCANHSGRKQHIS